MKRIDPLNGLLLFLMILVFASCHKDEVVPKKGIDLVLNATEQHQATADNAFTFDLFKSVQATNATNSTNLFLSPLSVSFALGMTSNGAKGATLDAMKKTLNFTSFTQDEMNSYYNKLITDLPRLDPQTTLNIANSIWYRHGFNVLPQFISADSSYFHAKVQALDFNDPSSANTINNWVSDQTKGKIPKIVDQLSGDDVMYLINAIYFKSVWATKFDASQTRPGPFYLPDASIVQADFMRGDKINYNAYRDENVTVLELPYMNSKYSMVIVEPSQTKILLNLDTVTWNGWIGKLNAAEGQVIMPKFKFSYTILMNDVLKSLGMGVAFSGSADFTGISSAGGLEITKVMHKAFVAVDETGTEAAAATSVSVGLTAVAPTPPMIIDHPFLFVIREMKSGLILFAGKVNNPQLPGN
jgi:serine protease inhibitor